MVTYEEFIEEQRKKGKIVEEFNIIVFPTPGKSSFLVEIQGDPKEYIDVARKAKSLKNILVYDTATESFYESLKEFIIELNDEVKIQNNAYGEASKQDFLKGEEIVKGLISQINPNWTTKQKVAFVHYNIAKLISYIPDFKLIMEEGNERTKGARSTWGVLSKGKGVCNGITFVQQNILSRLGIKTQELSSGTHSFLLIETEEGNIITDATWDLTNCLYGAMPAYFGVTYEELRKREEGISNSHRLENPPENVIEIGEEELREIFHSIGVTNEDRSFKFPLFRKVCELEKEHFETSEEKIEEFLKLLAQNFPEEVTHLEETRNILEMFISQKMEISAINITTTYVYDKNDEECENPHLILHINSEEMKNKVKFLNLDTMNFEDISIEDLDKAYKQHDNSNREPFWKRLMINKDDKSINDEEKTNEDK